MIIISNIFIIISLKIIYCLLMNESSRQKKDAFEMTG